ncbi:MAG TPA: beta-galactosidase trimerization domain-containing protein [Polyangiaceae bacterium]|nr:beta-galactosidase trimerization domain-containing protein [Polyangiaceae bacterium]
MRLRWRLLRERMAPSALGLFIFALFGCGDARHTATAAARRVKPVVPRVASARSTGAMAAPVPPVDPRRTTIRLRISGLAPGVPALAGWRAGGEGLGGEVRKGAILGPDGAGPLLVGQWSQPLALDALLPPGSAQLSYVTLIAGDSGREKGHVASKNVQFELEQLFEGRVIRSLNNVEVEGGTLTLVVPGAGSSSLVSELSTAGELAKARQKFLLGYAGDPPKQLPRQFAIVSDLGGFGNGSGYGIRVTSPDVMRTELASLLQLGATGLRTAPEFLLREGLHGRERLRARVLGPIGYPTPDKRYEPAVAGCPFEAGVDARAALKAESAIAHARAQNSEQVWLITVDEIGAVTDLAPEGKAHLATCERCRAGFVHWLKAEHHSLAELGATRWADVRPLDTWKGDLERPWLKSAGLRRRAYLTRAFLNVVSASMFTRLRDEVARYNAQPKVEATAPSVIYSYALRGCTFISNGSSLDFFEFYRHADNAIVWETSNRDARSWGWDSYLMDVQRVLGEKLGLAQGIYIKPHRGAPIQRALSAVSRGDTFIYWYTYGPDYFKGDAFSSDPRALAQAQRAAQLLGAAETWLYGAKPLQSPRVAIVKPETTSVWTLLGNTQLPVTSLENAKWVYTALQHAHVPVDPLDERFLVELDLKDYAAIYVNGSHLTKKAAAALARYVKRGGVLVTSAGGLLRDEADEPLLALDAVFGVKQRKPPELACVIDIYRAVRFQSLTSCAEIDQLQARFNAQVTPVLVGSERLEPLPGAEILARYRDGSPAMLRHAFGKGRAYLIGTFAGLEYAAPTLRDGFDMQRDFDASRRSYLLEPIADLLQVPVECSAPLVEPVLLKAGQGQGFVLTLANWAYADDGNDPETTGNFHTVVSQPVLDLKLTIHHVPITRRMHSVALGRDLEFERTADGVTLTLDRLDEGDVLLLE